MASSAPVNLNNYEICWRPIISFYEANPLAFNTSAILELEDDKLHSLGQGALSSLLKAIPHFRSFEDSLLISFVRLVHYLLTRSKASTQEIPEIFAGSFQRNGEFDPPSSISDFPLRPRLPIHGAPLVIGARKSAPLVLGARKSAPVPKATPTSSSKGKRKANKPFDSDMDIDEQPISEKPSKRQSSPSMSLLGTPSKRSRTQPEPSFSMGPPPTTVIASPVSSSSREPHLPTASASGATSSRIDSSSSMSTPTTMALRSKGPASSTTPPEPQPTLPALVPRPFKCSNCISTVKKDACVWFGWGQKCEPCRKGSKGPCSFSLADGQLLSHMEDLADCATFSSSYVQQLKAQHRASVERYTLLSALTNAEAFNGNRLAAAIAKTAQAQLNSMIPSLSGTFGNVNNARAEASFLDESASSGIAEVSLGPLARALNPSSDSNISVLHGSESGAESDETENQ